MLLTVEFKVNLLRAGKGETLRCKATVLKPGSRFSVFVNFTQSSAELLRLRQAMAAGRLRGAGDGAATVRIVLDDGSELPRPGRLLFSEYLFAFEVASVLLLVAMIGAVLLARRKES